MLDAIEGFIFTADDDDDDDDDVAAIVKGPLLKDVMRIFLRIARHPRRVPVKTTVFCPGRFAFVSPNPVRID
ncbi:hypothetical protein QE152_g29987 [Popillia japonica]|uniref:Uncharacterized protein n=1 Tax=Popillia japonica TaxID=7064 RepID=A0AAW1JG40_POPJA